MDRLTNASVNGLVLPRLPGYIPRAIPSMVEEQVYLDLIQDRANAGLELFPGCLAQPSDIVAKTVHKLCRVKPDARPHFLEVSVGFTEDYDPWGNSTLPEGERTWALYNAHDYLAWVEPVGAIQALEERSLGLGETVLHHLFSLCETVPGVLTPSDLLELVASYHWGGIATDESAIESYAEMGFTSPEDWPALPSVVKDALGGPKWLEPRAVLADAALRRRLAELGPPGRRVGRLLLGELPKARALLQPAMPLVDQQPYSFLAAIAPVSGGTAMDSVHQVINDVANSEMQEGDGALLRGAPIYRADHASTSGRRVRSGAAQRQRQALCAEHTDGLALMGQIVHFYNLLDQLLVQLDGLNGALHQGR